MMEVFCVDTYYQTEAVLLDEYCMKPPTLSTSHRENPCPIAQGILEIV